MPPVFLFPHAKGRFIDSETRMDTLLRTSHFEAVARGRLSPRKNAGFGSLSGESKRTMLM
ncbi:MAG: hypothetical protein DCC46_07010 [Armatimonadetes bacterium]|nr:MAG: hypothetical protein DCC46_07010 [Armatimonadota bacterium]